MARQGQIEIAGGIGPLLQPQSLANALHQVVRHLLALAEGRAGDAEAAPGVSAQMLEPLPCQGGFRVEVAVEVDHGPADGW